MIKILHLSDLHFGEGHGWDQKLVPKLECAISDTLKDLNIKVDCIILTGDLTTNGKNSELKSVKYFINNLINQNITNDNFDVLMTPGNHDFRWRNDNGEVNKDYKERSEIFFLINRSILNDIREKNIKNIENIKSKINFCLPNDLKGQMENEGIDWTYFSKTDTNILLIALNSMKMDSEEDKGIGYFGDEQLKTLKSFVDFFRKEIKENNLTILALCHHHLVPVASVDYGYVEKKRTSITLDSRAVLNNLQEMGCRVIFHGHYHQPSCVSWRDRIGEGKRTINIIGAGSVGAKRELLGDISQNQFYIHTIQQSNIKSDSYIQGSQDRRKFFFDEKWSSDISWSPPHINDEDCQIFYMMPKNACKVKSLSEIDQSDLFFLFLNVVDINKIRKTIYDFSKNYDHIKICGLYDLYGKFDFLVRFREEKNEGKNFFDKLKKHLIDEKLLRESDVNSNYHLIDVTTENYTIDDFIEKKSVFCHRVLLDDINEKNYKHPRITAAFLEILLNERLTANKFLKELKKEIKSLKTDHSINIEDVIKGIHSYHNDKIILELRMPCNQFHYLNILTKAIEEIIDPRGIDKWTHIAYTCQEFPG